MSRYRRGDVVLADIVFFDDSGDLKSKPRPLVVIDVQDDTDNVTVVCSTKTHKASKFEGIIVKKASSDGRDMSLDEDTFIYCNTTVVLLNKDIKRRIGTCPLIKDICEKLGYTPEDED